MVDHIKVSRCIWLLVLIMLFYVQLVEANDSFSFDNTWYFNQAEGQVILGSAGCSAILGVSDAKEEHDPTWIAHSDINTGLPNEYVLAFDGKDDLLTLPDTTNLDLSDGFAFEAWIYQSEKTEYARVMAKGRLQFYINTNGTLQAYVRNSTSSGPANGVIYSLSADAIRPQTWTHVGILYEPSSTGASLRLFINGIEVTYRRQDNFQPDQDRRLDVLNAPVTIGNTAARKNGFNGFIAYARLSAPNTFRDKWSIVPTVQTRQRNPVQLPEYSLNEFRLTLDFAQLPNSQYKLEVFDPTTKVWDKLATTQLRLVTAFSIDRKYMAPDGTIRFRQAPDAPGAWAYLMPITKGQDADITGQFLKSHAIAYTRIGDEQSEFVINLNSHSVVPTLDVQGRLTQLVLDGELLYGVTGETQASGGLLLSNSAINEDISTFEYIHADQNPLCLTVRTMGDRLRFTYEYQVVKSIEKAILINTKLNVPETYNLVESLNWRRDHEYKSVVNPDARYIMAQLPFVLVRQVTGPYIGVLDYAASSLVTFFDAADHTFNIEMWLWPSMEGQRYEWSFEILVGYEPYYNAFLRALNPHTQGFKSELEGGMSNRSKLETWFSARVAYSNNIRVIWLHGWFYRNGLYFDSDRPENERYLSIWNLAYSYEQLKREVENAHAEGLKAYIYIQFAGVSEDVIQQFAPSVVKNQQGQQVVAGHDGGISNIWVNPNPDDVYGSSILAQIDALLAATSADGIALDRADRLDYTYGTAYDYGAFDGFASPPTGMISAMPVSSITFQGKRFMNELRKILDSHGAELISNLPITPLFYQLSDGVLIDQPMTPWKLFFMRASANGKPFFVLDTTPGSSSDDKAFIAALIRSHPHGDYAFGDVKNSRLQYVIPSDLDYPAFWLFSDGTSVINYDGYEASLREKFKGSRFEPWPTE